ncbi:MAG: hypothetical protein BWY51_00070 [Parcubacteria group bacterium ADurb.Bin316]|nr:MAG: hypothetical protein BWY51_00070 [Parcubacteria group bacterium ADurb.Bin316]HOZ56030.1 hypothetical protein [bacterium]
MAQAARITFGATSAPKKKAKKKTVASEFKMHVRRMLVVLFNTICGNILFYILVGIINRMVGRPIKSIFLFYSVNIEYRRTMIPDWYAKVVAWRPGLGQVIGHGSWCGGLSFGITSNDDDFRNPENKAKLHKLYHDVDFIRRVVGAEQMTFSGVLPGVFVSLGIVKEDESLENANTVKVVMKAVDEVVRLEGMKVDCPVVVLGGRGFIGRRIAELLESYERKVYSVDTKDRTTIPQHLKGTATIVLNITKAGALSEYIPRLWKEAIIVNEVYPEPSVQEQTLMRVRGLRCYHITGVKASALPRFMKAYKGGIPCCAAYLPDDNFQALVTKLV